ncbi:hypothetical protein DUNSADRAFT_1727 [Dunaliella salina]|uniref:Uncharacterized protein n=1 Tax=Dunaliella salina TaxID=3046 RepID=A0ABQ7GWQ5_DUNSA|nr:hypothetical protein DUNSADRAFT_1727 [Dunaliella salina]|eukprot:KAF5839030.1 hypothetical protein DUNSADRAFT_1727 [Dunaliella salina]
MSSMGLERWQCGIGEVEEEVERLHVALRVKEQAAASLQVRNAALERELHLQSSTVQDVVLLQQRLAKANEEAISMGEGMRKAFSEVAALDNTLTHVQRELTVTKHQLGETQHELDDKTSQLTSQLQELHTYYASVLEAKESSVASLQGLLASQQAAMQEQQALWDEQRTALQDSLHVLRDSANANAAAAAKSTAEALGDHRRQEQGITGGSKGSLAWQELPRGRWESKPQADLVLFLEGKVDRLEREKGALAQEKSDLLREKSGLLQEKNDILQERSDLSLEIKELVHERGLLQRRLQGQEQQLESVESDRGLRLEEFEAKLEEMERKAAYNRSELERRVHALEGQLKDRDKLLLKADKRYQELTRKHLALGNAFESAMASSLAAPPPVNPYASGWPLADHTAGNRHKNGAVYPWASPALKHGSALGLDAGSTARDAQLKMRMDGQRAWTQNIICDCTSVKCVFGAAQDAHGRAEGQGMTCAGDSR